MFLIFSTLVLITFLFFIFYLKKKNQYWKLKGLPGPKPVLLFGNIKPAVLRKENLAETLQKIYDGFPNEPMVGMYRMTSPCILVRDLDIIKHILIKDFDKFEDRGVEFSKEGMGANLFHADGETWRVLRNKFTPLFTTGKLKNMVYLIDQKSDVILKYFDEITTHKPEQELLKHMRRYTASTIATCAFGLEFDTISESLMNILMKIDNLVLSCNIFHEIDMMFPGVLKKINSSLFPADVPNFFHNMVSNVISNRNGMPSGRHDFMDLILEMRGQDVSARKNYEEKNIEELKLTLTDEIIAAQALVFYIAGYETSASVLTYLMYELALHPEIQEKFIKEIDNVLQKNNGHISYDTVSNNQYMEKVFQEVYRKYPIIPVFRKSNADYNVPGTNFTIKKDTVVLLSVLGIHYDEKYYPEPEKFDPERFSPENELKRHSCAFLPYGIGPRNCIGIRFGKLQTRVFAMKFFSKYRVETSKNTKKFQIDPTRIVISPMDGIHLNIIPRKTKEH